MRILFYILSTTVTDLYYSAAVVIIYKLTAVVDLGHYHTLMFSKDIFILSCISLTTVVLIAEECKQCL